jgi:SP family general alpha glucoside:H+ symporter-like MFS transporter
MGGPIGQVVGSLLASYPLEWYGQKMTFGVCVILTAAFIFNQFFATSVHALLVGELPGGLVLGFYAVLTPTYGSEVCPVVLRGIVTCNINLFIVIGQLLETGVLAQKSSSRIGLMAHHLLRSGCRLDFIFYYSRLLQKVSVLNPLK